MLMMAPDSILVSWKDVSGSVPRTKSAACISSTSTCIPETTSLPSQRRGLTAAGLSCRSPVITADALQRAMLREAPHLQLTDGGKACWTGTRCKLKLAARPAPQAPAPATEKRPQPNRELRRNVVPVTCRTQRWMIWLGLCQLCSLCHRV